MYPTRMDSSLPIVVSSRGTVSAKFQSSNTMSAYDAALAAMQKETKSQEGISRTSTSAASSMPMSGGAAYQNKQYSGVNISTPEAQQHEYAKNQYRKAEKQLLLEAKTLAQVAAKSFEEAQALKDGDKGKYLEAIAKANQERASVDHLLAAANEMKGKAEKSSMGPRLCSLCSFL